MTSVAVTLAGETLASPLVAASGTVGSVTDFVGSVDFSLYGAAVTKSVAPEPWRGRSAPRIAPLREGMLNSIGIQNPGIDVWLDEVAPALDEVPTRVWASIVAHDPDGFGAVAATMTRSSIAAIEVNLSCPNLDGVPFALDPAPAARVVASVRAATAKPIGAKLSADARSVTEVASAVMAAGADWVVMGNTIMGAAIDVHSRRPLTSGLISGYSGAPIRPVMMRCVLELKRDLPDVPVVACGGVSHADHVVEYILAGADAVGVGSAHFAQPRVARRIIAGVRKYMKRNRIDDLAQLRGAYLPWE